MGMEVASKYVGFQYFGNDLCRHAAMHFVQVLHFGSSSSECSPVGGLQLAVYKVR